ncbi:hypothetical protein [Phaeobacter inhibens]|uniref:hypothetical protein n=1 Tax=Phaeobacter inhibens TaxID=221822 RepID=UPI000C9B62AA|nr:hypothetical protein [Phaeobacter inhibens]AUQ68366.1 hypothetical protein PhaeoP78_03549 [Phaeobacter inhibens]
MHRSFIPIHLLAVVAFGVSQTSAQNSAVVTPVSQPAETTKPDPLPPSNDLPGLSDGIIQGIEIAEPRVSCNLKTGLAQTWKATFPKGGATATEDLFKVAVERCTYVMDQDAELHRFTLGLAFDMSPSAEAAAACKVVSTALLTRLASSSAELQWPGITTVLREGSLKTPESEDSTPYTLASIDLRAVQRNSVAGANFQSYLYATLMAFEDDVSNQVKNGTFSNALAASVPLSDVDFFAPSGGTGGQPDKRPEFAAETFIDMTVDLDVLGFKAVCLNDDGRPNAVKLEAK